MYMKAKDAISGREGSLFANIDGEVIEVAECRNIEATIEKKKVEFRSLGHRGTQYKATGWSGTGTMTLYFATTTWTKMMVDYVKTGKDVYFKLVGTNEDPTSDIGRQVVALLDCNINKDTILKLDVDADFLDKSVDFTFSDVEVPEEFTGLPQ